MTHREITPMAPSAAPVEPVGPSTPFKALNQSHWRAVEELLEGVREERSILVLTGPEGAGAEAAMREAIACLPKRIVAVEAYPQRGDLSAILEPLEAALCKLLPPPGKDDQPADRVNKALEQLACEDRGIVYFLDPREPLTDAALVFLARLAANGRRLTRERRNLREGADKPLRGSVGAQIVLSAPPEALEVLSQLGDSVMRRAANEPIKVELFDGPALRATFRQHSGGVLSPGAVEMALAATGGQSAALERLLTHPMLVAAAQSEGVAGAEGEPGVVSAATLAEAIAALGMNAPEDLDPDVLDERDRSSGPQQQETEAALALAQQPFEAQNPDAAAAEAADAEISNVAAAEEAGQAPAPALDDCDASAVEQSELVSSAVADREQDGEAAAGSAEDREASGEVDGEPAPTSAESWADEDGFNEKGVEEAPAGDVVASQASISQSSEAQAAVSEGAVSECDADRDAISAATPDDAAAIEEDVAERVDEPSEDPPDETTDETSDDSGAPDEPDDVTAGLNEEALLGALAEVEKSLSPEAMEAAGDDAGQEKKGVAQQLLAAMGAQRRPTAAQRLRLKEARPARTLGATRRHAVILASLGTCFAVALAASGLGGAALENGARLAGFELFAPSYETADARLAPIAEDVEQQKGQEKRSKGGEMLNGLVSGALSTAEQIARGAADTVAPTEGASREINRFADGLFLTREDMAREDLEEQLAALPAEEARMKREQIIADALRRAEDHAAAGRFTAPKGSNGYEQLLKAYRLAPRDPRVRGALAALVKHYEAQASDALQNEKYQKFHKLNWLADRIRGRKPI